MMWILPSKSSGSDVQSGNRNHFGRLGFAMKETIGATMGYSRGRDKGHPFLLTLWKAS